MSHKNIETCKHGKDLIKYCEQCGCEVRSGNGSHKVVYNKSVSNSGVTIPNNELGKGLKHKIIKQLLAIGISVLFLFVIFGNMV